MSRWGWPTMVLAVALGAAAMIVPWRDWPRRLGVAAAGCWVTALGLLAVAFVRSDFTLATVADFSRRHAPAPLRLAGLWGGMEGSLLLWTTTLALVAVLGVRGERAWRWSSGAVTAFGAVATFLASPFDRLALPPVDGGGLTPILEHPAMVVHPPLLYGGLALFLVPWARAVGGSASSTELRRLIGLGWAVTTVGLLLGARWAYVEVGWGGFWGWDPVENGALVPWFAALAAVHALRRPPVGDAGADEPSAGRLPRLASAAPFVAVAAAAMVTRSGWSPSVHSFAAGRSIGVALAVLAETIVASTVWAIAVPHQRGDAVVEGRAGSNGARRLDTWGTFARFGSPVTPTLLASLAVAVICAGIGWPFVADLTAGRGLAVDGTFYAAIFGPLAAIAALGVAVAPWTRMSGDTAANGGLGALCTVAAAAAGGLIAWHAGWPHWPSVPLAMVAAGAVASVALSLALSVPVGRWPLQVAVAHGGFALFLVGIAGSTATAQAEVVLAPHASAELAGYHVTNRAVRVDAGPSGASGRVVAVLDVSRGRRAIAVLTPALVAFADKGRLLGETDLRSRPSVDLQASLDRADDAGNVVVTVRVRPLAQVLWAGALLMAAGGAWGAAVAALSGARRRCAIVASRPEPRDGRGATTPVATGADFAPNSAANRRLHGEFLDNG